MSILSASFLFFFPYAVVLRLAAARVVEMGARHLRLPEGQKEDRKAPLLRRVATTEKGAPKEDPEDLDWVHRRIPREGHHRRSPYREPKDRWW